MKKFKIFIATFLFIFSLCSCNNNQKNTDTLIELLVQKIDNLESKINDLEENSKNNNVSELEELVSKLEKELSDFNKEKENTDNYYLDLIKDLEDQIKELKEQLNNSHDNYENNDDIFVINNIDDLFTRHLSDKEIKELTKSPSLKACQEKISTINDAIAFLDYCNPPCYSGGPSIIKINDLFFDHVNGFQTTAATIGLLTGYFLEDDIKGLEYLYAMSQVNNTNYVWPATTLAIPYEEGYHIICPANYSNILNNNHCSALLIKNIDVGKDLNNIGSLLRTNDNNLVFQLFSFSTLENQYYFEEENFTYTCHGAKEIYSIDENIKKSLESESNLKKLRQEYSRYGMSNKLKSKLSDNEIKDLVGKDLDTVKDAISTLPDLMTFYALNCYHSFGHDLNVYDSVRNDGTFWHFNYEPYTCYEHNYGCCGTTSGLTACILEGDYDEVGICGMTFTEGAGGGHVINYIKNGNEYYVFDMVNLVGTNYGKDGFNYHQGSSLKSTCLEWIDSVKDYWPIELFYCYQSSNGDAPIGWGIDFKHNLVPKEYKENAVIILEQNGYYYDFVDVDSSVWKDINRVRSTL